MKFIPGFIVHRNLPCPMCGLFLLLCVSSSHADESTAKIADDRLVIVFRIAGTLFEDTINRDFERSDRFADWVLDVYGAGNTSVTGKTHLDFKSSQLEQPLTVEVTGDVRATSVGYRGAFMGGSHTCGSYRVLVGIDFDGKKFHAVPAQAQVCLQSTLDWARFRRTRLGRRLITPIARRLAPRQIPRYDRHVEREAETRVKNDSPGRIDAMLEQVNEAVKIEQTLTALAVTNGVQRRITKADTYIQVRVAPEDCDRMPPTEELTSKQPIEIWFYPAAKRPALANLFQDQLKLKQIGDWDVVRLDVSVPELAADLPR